MAVCPAAAGSREGGTVGKKGKYIVEELSAEEKNDERFDNKLIVYYFE